MERVLFMLYVITVLSAYSTVQGMYDCLISKNREGSDVLKLISSMVALAFGVCALCDIYTYVIPVLEEIGTLSRLLEID